MALFGGGDTSLQIVIKARDEASRVFSSLESKVKKTSGALKGIGTGMTAIGGVVALVGKNAVEAASDFEETASKFGTVFQDVGDEAEKMAQDIKKNFGLSEVATKRLLSNTGDLLTGFNFTGEQALELSGNVNKLAVDLASFTNAQGGAEAVSSALTKALLGERESLKTYGIAIMEADINAELLAQGMDKLTGEALRQAKAQITLDLAMRQSKNAIGDFERTSASFANQQRILAARFEDVRVIIGNALLPIMTELLNKITPIIEKTGAWIEANPELAKKIILISTAIGAVLVVLGPLLVMLGFMVSALPALGAAFVVLTGPIGLVVAAIGTIIATGYFLMKNWDTIKWAAGIVWEEIKNIVGEAVEWVDDKVQKAISAWNKMVSIVTKPIKAASGFVSSTFSSVKSGMGFEHGGTVPGPVGTAVPILAHGQETVIPAGQSRKSANGLSVTINNPVVRSNEDILKIRKEIDRYFKPLILNHKITA